MVPATLLRIISVTRYHTTIMTINRSILTDRQIVTSEFAESIVIIIILQWNLKFVLIIKFRKSLPNEKMMPLMEVIWRRRLQPQAGLRARQQGGRRRCGSC